MFCKFCGKEISDTAKFCQGCGGKVSESGSVADFIKEKSQSLQGININPGFENVKDKMKSAGPLKKLYAATVLSFLLNFIFHFVGILKYDLWLTEGNVSLFSGLSKLGSFGYDDTLSFLSFILWTGPILIILSVVVWSFKKFIKKRSAEKGLVFVLFAVIYSNFLQLVGVIIIISSENDGLFGSVISLTAAGYFLFIFAISTIVLLIMSYSSLKKSKIQSPKVFENNTDSAEIRGDET